MCLVGGVELPPWASWLTELVVIQYALVALRRVHGEAVPGAVVKTAVCLAEQFAPCLLVILVTVVMAFLLAMR